MSAGCLYVVATPIGNMGDITLRALETLRNVDFIAAEDTRHTQRLLNHHGVSAKIFSLHEHNELVASEKIVEKLLDGENGALVSDAGTPLINDPGFPLIRLCYQQHVRVSPIPGPSAFVAALSAAGLPVNDFSFHGFMPRKSSARTALLNKVSRRNSTQVFYESSHRILACAKDMASVLDPGQQVAIVRELSKIHEDFIVGVVGDVLENLAKDPNRQKGEFVILIAPAVKKQGIAPEQEKMLLTLLDELPVKQAASIAAKLTGLKKNDLYKLACELKQ